MHFGSYFTSILLHAALFALVLFWPAPPPLDLNTPMMQISLTMGAPGGDKLPSPVLGHQGRITSRPDAQPADPGRPEATPETPRPKQTEALPADTRPEPRAVAQSRPQPESRVAPVPVPVKEPEAAKIPEVSPIKKQDEPLKPKPEEKKAEEKKTDPKPPADVKADKPPKPETAKPAKPSGSDALKSALASAQREAGASRSSSPPRRGSPIAGALASLQSEAKKEGTGGGGGEGDGPGGGGLNDVYAGLVILAVRPNWSVATYGRDQLVALVRVRLDPEGNVLDASLERGSGRADFDSSTVNAVIRTKKLPKPPTPEQQDLILTFNSLELAGGR